MGKKIIAVLLLLCVSFSVFSLDMKNAEPYEKDEFPKWAVDLRRSEIIFFGSVPFTYTATSLIANKAFKKDINFWKTAAIAGAASATITLIDFIIGQIKK